MNLSIKKKSIFTLAILLVIMICLSFATSGVSLIPTRASGSQNCATFEMIEGAQVRTDEKRAIRFVTKISQSEYDALASDDKKVEVVTMITPARYLDRVGLNNAEGFVKECAVLKEEIIFSADYGFEPVAKEDGYYYFNACIFGVQDTNITQKFAARSYLLVDGELLTYTDYDKSNNRSICEIALETKNLPQFEGTDAYDNLHAISSGKYVEKYAITVNGIDEKTLTISATYGQPLYAFTKEIEETFNKEGAYYWTGLINGENEFNESTPIKESGKVVNATFISLSFVEDGDGLAVAGASKGFYDMTSVVKIPETFDGKTVKSICAGAFTTGVKEIHIPEDVVINANAFSGVYPTIVIGENTYTYKANATKTDYMSYRVDGNGELVFYDEFIEIAYAYDDNYIAIPTPAEIADANSDWRKTYEKYVDQTKIGTADLDTPEEWWMAVYTNASSISEEDKVACYYVKGLNDKSLTVVNIPETFDDGVHGELPVKYIGKGAFMGNTTITKVFATETLTELRGTAFSGASNLQVAVLPGVKYLADIRNSSGTIWMRENFNYCDSLTSLVVGDNFTLSGANFVASSSTSDGWYTISTYFNGERPSFDYTNWKAHGYLLSDTKRYEYGVCDGKHWYYDENGEPKLTSTTHQYVEGKCKVCGAIEITTITYAYDANFIPMPTPAEIADANSDWRKTYEKYVDQTKIGTADLDTPEEWWTQVYNNKANIAEEDFVKCYYVKELLDKTLTEVKILGTFNDGVHGELDVRYIGQNVFASNTTILKVFATEKTTELRGKVFRTATNLQVVVLPGVKYISNKYNASGGILMHRENFYNCDNLRKLVVADECVIATANFKPAASSSSGWYVVTTYYCGGIGAEFNVATNQGNYLLSNSKRLEYDETGLLEGKYWHFDENGEPVHNVHVDSGADGKCDTCADAMPAA